MNKPINKWRLEYVDLYTQEREQLESFPYFAQARDACVDYLSHEVEELWDHFTEDYVYDEIDREDNSMFSYQVVRIPFKELGILNLVEEDDY